MRGSASRELLLGGHSSASTPNAWHPEALRAGWHQRVAGRKLRAIGRHKPEVRGREAGQWQQRCEYLEQHLAGSRHPRPGRVMDPGWPHISICSQALIRCGKCSVTAPERVYVQNRCLGAGAGAVAPPHFINYISLPLP